MVMQMLYLKNVLKRVVSFGTPVVIADLQANIGESLFLLEHLTAGN